MMVDYTSYVNIKQGTFSEPRYSCGNTLPLIASPFGMNSFCLQTRAEGGNWFFHPTHRQTEGVRLTHQPSPWMGDYGHMVFMPQTKDVYITENERSTGFEEINLNPAFMEVYLKRYRVRLGIAARERSAIMSMKWETGDTPRFAILPFAYTTEIVLNPEKRELTGYSYACSDGTTEDFRLYFYMKFDKTVNIEKTVLTKHTGEKEKKLSGCGTGVGMNIAFDMPVGEELTVRLGTSFISSEYAKKNAERELGDKSYGEIKEKTRGEWNALLSKIAITDTVEKKKIFYSCLYRCFLFPHIFYEYNDRGEPVHYSIKSGRINKGIMYTDNGFWDTYRTLYPLFALIIPDRMKEMMEGYLNFYKEEGWLPKWLSPGERGIMPGTLIDAVLADAAVKDLLTAEQMQLALEGMLKNAGTVGDSPRSGRIGVADYLKKGYVPSDKYHESVNNSLDAYYCDFCISQMAEKLGQKEIQDKFLKRSQNYNLLFDEATGFMRGRKENGEWSEPFSPIIWGGDYCEGGAWQNSFSVFHDIDGLAELYGGKEKFAEKLDELFATSPFFETGTYHSEIHEMTEMSFADFGQCAISNQPSFHIPYLFAAIGYRDKTAYWVNRIVNEAFSSRDNGFPGDEDNGSMSAWYIFSVLGIYPICPGKAEYVVGVCEAKEIKILCGNGRTITIKNELFDSMNNCGIKMSIDNQLFTGSFLSHEQFLNAGFIRFYQ